MKILQINAVHRQLSTGRNVEELNQYLSEQGHHAMAAYSVGPILDPDTDYRIGGTMGQKCHALLSRLFGMQGYYSSFATRKFLKKVDAYKPDVVVLNNLHANYIHLPILLKYLAKKDIPTVAVLHDCWFYTGKCCYYTAVNCEKWKTQCSHCPAVDQHNKSWFFDCTAKMHKDRKKLFGAISRLGVVAVSDWLLEQAKDAPVFQNAVCITRIHNWIDTRQFAPVDSTAIRKKMGLEGKKVLLAVAAKWETRKGMDTLLKIGQELSENEVLVIVGRLANPKALLPGMIHIPSTDSKEELVQCYSMADVFLQPSMEETFGKVTAEALACGTPVVCYDSSANPELIGEGCGAVVPLSDTDGMLREARNIISRGKAEYSARCRAFVEDRFNTERIFDQYLQLFLKLQEGDLCK